MSYYIYKQHTIFQVIIYQIETPLTTAFKIKQTLKSIQHIIPRVEDTPSLYKNISCSNESVFSIQHLIVRQH